MHYFLSWETLATICGASVIVACITQLLKQKLCKIPTQIVTYFISLAILTAATIITGGLETWQDWALVPIKALVVSFTANGEYGFVKRVFG